MKFKIPLFICVFVLCLSFLFQNSNLNMQNGIYTITASAIDLNKVDVSNSTDDIYNSVVEVLVENNIENYGIGIDDGNNQIVVEVNEEYFVYVSMLLSEIYGDNIRVINADISLSHTDNTETNNFNIKIICYILAVFFLIISSYVFLYINNQRTRAKQFVNGRVSVNRVSDSSVINSVKCCVAVPDDALLIAIKDRINEVKNVNS